MAAPPGLALLSVASPWTYCSWKPVYPVHGSWDLCTFEETMNFDQIPRPLPASQLLRALGFSCSVPVLACVCASFIPGEGSPEAPVNDPALTSFLLCFPWQQPVNYWSPLGFGVISGIATNNMIFDM